jgi:diketogulonate reductase-like aldo/keto reductase
MEIPYLKLNNGVLMPILGLGTWDLKGERGTSSVKEAISLGYRHIDTAEFYRNEEDIGKAVKDFPRKKLFIVSKVWPLHLSYNGVHNSCNKSLAKLGTDYLDLYLIHWPKLIGGIQDSVKAFKELYVLGKIKSFGVSNYSIKNLKEILPIAERFGLKVSVNQIKYTLFHHDDELVDFCKKNDIIVTAYSPLDRGNAVDNSKLIEIAKKYNKTPSQIILRWIIQKDIVVIPKASSRVHLSENINVFDFKINDKDMEEMDKIIKK